MVKKHFISRHVWVLIGIFALALLVRLWGIDAVPSGITHDELDYYLGGKFLGLTGSDFTGTWKWWTLSPMGNGIITAELTPLFFIPIATLFPSSLFFAKLTPVLFSAGMIFIMYWFLVLISKGNRRLGLLGAILLAINPWSIIFGRTSYEITISLFWYFLSVTVYLSVVVLRDKTRKILSRFLISLMALFFGYFTYHGYKFLVPFIALVEIIGYFLLRPHLKESIRKYWWYFVLPLVLAGILLTFSWMRSSVFGTRSDEISFVNIGRYTSFMKDQNRLSLISPLHNYLQSTFIFFGKDALITYFDLFSPSRLFLSAKDGYTLNFPQHGYFYLIEIVFIFMGVLQIIRRKSYWICLMLAVISPIPSAVHIGMSYALRSQLLIVAFIALAAIGINYIFNYHSIRTVIGIAGLYIISFGYFAYVYLYQGSVHSADQYLTHFRIVSSYIKRANSSPILVLTSQPYYFYRSYLFYSNEINASNASQIQQQFRNGLAARYQIGNVIITDDCGELINIENKTVIIDTLHITSCRGPENNDPVPQIDLPYVEINSLSDYHAFYRVYNPHLCNDYYLYYYPTKKNLTDFSMEQMSNEEFCMKWMVKK